MSRYSLWSSSPNTADVTVAPHQSKLRPFARQYLYPFHLRHPFQPRHERWQRLIPRLPYFSVFYPRSHCRQARCHALSPVSFPYIHASCETLAGQFPLTPPSQNVGNHSTIPLPLVAPNSRRWASRGPPSQPTPALHLPTTSGIPTSYTDLLITIRLRGRLAWRTSLRPPVRRGQPDGCVESFCPGKWLASQRSEREEATEKQQQQRRGEQNELGSVASEPVVATVKAWDEVKKRAIRLSGSSVQRVEDLEPRMLRVVDFVDAEACRYRGL